MIVKRLEKNGKIKAMYSSSTICGSVYDKDTKELTMIFKNGGQYKFPNVESTDYMRLETADSNGSAFTKYIKNKYQNFEKLTKLSEESIKSIIKEIDELKALEEKSDTVNDIVKTNENNDSVYIAQDITNTLNKVTELHHANEITQYEYKVLIEAFNFLKNKGVSHF
jgi:glutaredoxin 2